jgi:anti-sigma factor RsiW
MKHKNIEKLIQKALDREITEKESQTLEAHLAHCPACRQFHAQMVQTEQSLSTLVEVFPQHTFNARVLNKLGLRRAFSWRKVVPVGAAAWVVSLLVLAFLPWPQAIIRRLATSIPEVVRFFDNAGLVVTSLSNVLMPFAKSTLNVQYAVFGLIMMVLTVFAFNRAIKKEAQCNY